MAHPKLATPASHFLDRSRSPNSSPGVASLPNLSPEIPSVCELSSTPWMERRPVLLSSPEQSFSVTSSTSRRTRRPSSSPTISRGRHTASFPLNQVQASPAVIEKSPDIYQADRSLSTGRPSTLTFSSSSAGNLEQLDKTGFPENNRVGDGWQVASETSHILSFALPSGDENYQKLHDSQVFRYVGVNSEGVNVFMFSACRLPPRKEADYDQLMHYCMRTLESNSESPYCLVYLHQGLGCWNMPSREWIWRMYETLDRTYRKNMTGLYVVHPTKLVLVLWSMCLPVLSFKFWRKVEYIRTLKELQSKLKCSDIYRHVPTEILDFDRCQKEFLPQRMVKWLNRRPLEPTRQFGATLSHIAKNNGGDSIPPILRQCVEYLDDPMALSTRGLFIFGAADLGIMRELKNRANRGEAPDFGKAGSVHIPANLMKHFFFDLQEPLFPYDIYDEILAFNSVRTKDDRLNAAKVIVIHQLPHEHYEVLKYLTEFLLRVLEDSDVNCLAAAELALAFAPTLAWNRVSESSTDVFEDNRKIAFFLQYLIRYYRHIFTR